MDEGALRISIPKRFQYFVQGVRGRYQLARVKAHPLAAIFVGVLFEPLVRRPRIIHPEVGARPDLEWPQLVMNVLQLRMIRIQGQPSLGDLAGAPQGSRVDDGADLFQERLGSRSLRFAIVPA